MSYKYIKGKWLGLLRLIYLYYFRVFNSLYPIAENKYFFISMYGNSYGCNVKPISDYVLKESKNNVVWAFSPTMYPKVQNDNFLKVILKTFKYYKELYTSKYVIANFRLTKDLYPYKIKGQIYMQLWHGTALKKIEADMPLLNHQYIESVKSDSAKIDYFISGSRFMTNIYQQSFWYHGKVYETGTPRNDIFFSTSPDIQTRVRTFFNLKNGDKIALYAPTFRNNSDSFEFYDIDCSLIKESLTKKFGGKWILLIRLHPGLINKDNLDRIKRQFPRTLDASMYADMQELLYASDILITDYSSSMFDFMYSQKPCFLYVKDKDEYDRGFYFDINELPFPKVFSNSEWNSVISNFSQNLYINAIEKFKRQIGSVEDGLATKRCYELLTQNQ